ncbi:nuclear transport factor 2 family protein [Clostridium sp. SYSU_GA19001]|uniref:nuclear transport factor 2 family protein n=1 Tax=Clostridium caldaquaticum TaxID=2940653 RepID=UPI002076E873|nr:nuclear transport factor 2 family protein [Clostridium caldaquaticum]MCM8711256.1 nuclear transport factor 2 family protein [Clostridium caldaquaticum]
MDQKTFELITLKNDAYRKIQNVMGTYAFMLTAAKYDDICELFTKKQSDVRVEMNWGVYDGYEGVKRCYSNYHKNEVTGPGVMAVHALSTPVIEIADDLKTAKAVWISPGHITGGMFSKDKAVKAHWAWMRYGCDFINEDGDWKIWHLHVYGMFMTPFDKSWVEIGDAHEMEPFPPEYAPDRPPTYSWAYSPERVTEYVPAPPKPYATFDFSEAF